MAPKTKKALSSLNGTKAPAFVVPPIFNGLRAGRPFAFCCGKGTAPVSGPAGGAVFSGAVSVRSFQPRDLSLSGGVPDTHAPSWRWTLSAARAGAGRGNGENVSLRWRRGCGWGSSPRASPSLPGPDHGSAAQRWPRWWPWGRSAGHTAWRWTARCRPALRSGGR